MNDAETAERPTAADRRVQLWFGPHLLHSYRAGVTAAEEYAAAIGRRFPGLTIKVDAEVSDGLSPLPCEQLWDVLTP